MAPNDDFRALGAASIASAAGTSQDRSAQVFAYLTERGDEAIFACSASQKANSGGATDRLFVISRYRVLLVRWMKLRRPQFKELQLLDLRGITCEGDIGAWGFHNEITTQIKSERLQEAVKLTLKAHALITLCLDIPPLALSLPKQWGALGFDTEGREVDMGFSRTWLAMCSFSAAPTPASSGGADGGRGGPSAHDITARRQRTAVFLAQLIARPSRHDRVLDLSYCSELQATDFVAAALTLRHTSMFSGLRLHDVPLGDKVGALLQYARTSRTFEVVALSGVAASASALKALSEGICEAASAGKRPTLTEIDVSDNDLLRDVGVGAVAHIVGLLGGGLRTLDVSECRATPKATTPLLTALRGVMRQAQQLRQRPPPPDGALASPAQLEVLRLARNELNSKGLALLCEIATSADALRVLDVRACSCSVRHLCTALHGGMLHAPSVAARSLQHLHLCGNRLGLADVAALLHFLTDAVALTTLGLCKTHLEAEGLVSVLLAIGQNPKLAGLSLDASANPLGTLGAHALAAALPHAHALSAFRLNDVAKGPELLAAMAEGAGGEEAATLVPKEAATASVGVIVLQALLIGMGALGSKGGKGGGEGGGKGGGDEAVHADGNDRPKRAFALTELAIGCNPCQHGGALIRSLEHALLATPSLTSLSVSGGPTFRLKHELALLLGTIARASGAAGGAALTYLDVSSHHAGDSVLDAIAPLLRGPKAPRSLLLHDNSLSVRGIDKLAKLMTAAEPAEHKCRTELLVITHDDARLAFHTELKQARLPKEELAKRLQKSVMLVQQVIGMSRARRRLHPRMRHPRRYEGSAQPRLLAWPNWGDPIFQGAGAAMVAAVLGPASLGEDEDEEPNTAPPSQAEHATPASRGFESSFDAPSTFGDVPFEAAGGSAGAVATAAATAPEGFSASFGATFEPSPGFGEGGGGFGASFGDAAGFGASFDAPAAVASSGFGASFDAPAAGASGGFGASFDAAPADGTTVGFGGGFGASFGDGEGGFGASFEAPAGAVADGSASSGFAAAFEASPAFGEGGGGFGASFGDAAGFGASFDAPAAGASFNPVASPTAGFGEAGAGFGASIGDGSGFSSARFDSPAASSPHETFSPSTASLDAAPSASFDASTAFDIEGIASAPKSATSDTFTFSEQ